MTAAKPHVIPTAAGSHGANVSIKLLRYYVEKCYGLKPKSFVHH